METALPGDPPAPRRTFFGEPIGLAYLSFTELWERFSYYGMTALLPLYLGPQLFQPGRAENIVGFGPFRDAIEGLFHISGPEALGHQVQGLYSGLVYLTPILGGILADRWLGRRFSVAIGAVMMSAGHLAMAFDQSFLLALALLITGCGMLKGNISAQVGQLYRPEDGEGRTRGYSIYSIGINVGAVAGPLACAALAVTFGYHWGFGLAGVLMLLALATYLIGYRELGVEAKEAGPASATAESGKMQWKTIAALIGIMAITIFQSVAYYQNTNAAITWINDHVDLKLLGWAIPAEWFNSIDPFVSILIVPVLIGLWKWQDKRGGEPDEMIKIATGAALACVANLVLVGGIMLSGDRVSALYPIVYDILLGIGFIYYWPTLLALVAGAASPKLKSTLMGLAFVTLFVSNTTIGRLAAMYDQMDPAAFWAMHAGVAAVGAILAFLLAKPLIKVLREAEKAQE